MRSSVRSFLRLNRGMMSGSFAASARFIRRSLWLWPLLGAAVHALVGWWVHSRVEMAMHHQIGSSLTATLNADVAALRQWMQDGEQNATLLAGLEQLRPLVRDLLAVPDQGDGAELNLIHAPSQKALRAWLGPRLKQFGYVDYLLVSPQDRVLASMDNAPVGKLLTGYRRDFFHKVLQTGPAVSLPYRSPLLLPDENGELKAGLPTMFAAAPVVDEAGKPIAVVGLRIRPEERFTKILQIARIGDSGETYAFDRTGLFLSRSRFEDDLKRVGLLPDVPEATSILTLEARDPQVNLMEGQRPPVRRADQPLTPAVAQAVGGKIGLNLDGIRDYRGVPTVAAWTWLPEFGFGVITKMDAAEAFLPLHMLQVAFWVLMGLLVLSAVIIFLFMIMVARQQVAMQKAVLAAKQLGQYALEQKIGEGGMGSVFKARHAMLRRPTAVKLLDPEKTSPLAIARFEREVQLTSQLTHPHTIAIYDYGRTPEGVFYYAMEYLDGIDLEELVTRYGPLPEGRVVAILQMVCGSLAEAHALGLIHRDIKPANILLTQRGGINDFVKVLDFGLARALGAEKEGRLTSSSAMVGTPLYLAPETIQQPDLVDARTDLYSVGAVGYFLLTGMPVFEGGTLMETFMLHVNGKPQPPSTRLARPIHPKFEALLLQCLAKLPSDRPASAKAMFDVLSTLDAHAGWSHADAEAWWVAFRAGTLPPAAETAAARQGNPAATPLGQTVEYSGSTGEMSKP